LFVSTPDFFKHRSASRHLAALRLAWLTHFAWLGLLAAVLCTQSLGLVHKTVHAPGLWSAAQATVHADARPAPKAGLLAHLGAEATSSDCLIYDQLVQTAGFQVPPVLAVGMLPALPVPFVLRDQRRITPALFEARGPPVSEIA
jgi:hypothetical protein